MKRLAIVTTHPIQYNAPLYRLFAASFQGKLKVFYTWGKKVLENKFDPGFGKNIEWDIPLLDGYEYSFVENISDTPGSHTFKGIVNPTLNSEIESWNADAVLVYGWSFQSHLQCIRYFHKKIPVFFRGDSTLLDSQPFLKKIFRSFFLRWVYSHIDVALYAGTNNRSYFNAYGVPDKKLVFAPHAVDNERFADDEIKQYEMQAMEWREKLSYKSNDTVFLYAGKLEEKKDPLLLVNAFNKISDDSVHLLIAGNGPLEDALKEQASANNHIKFINFQNQSLMPVLYRVADCVILPSKGPGETWGLAVNEAMACSRPVIASNKCGCAVDLVRDNVNGYVFDSGNQEDICNKIEMFVSTEKRGICMRAAAARSISSWSFNEICKSLINILQ